MAAIDKPPRFEARLRNGEYRYRICGLAGEYLTEELSEEGLEGYYRQRCAGKLPPNFDVLITAANQYGTTDVRQRIPLDSAWTPAAAPPQAAVPTQSQPATKVATQPEARPPWWKRVFFRSHHA